jgi:ABC-type antimicrobial peptide transport system permease subunit
MSNASYKPPKLPNSLLKLFCDPELLEDVEGDINELFMDRSRHNKAKAKLFYYWDVLLLFRPGIIKQLLIFKTQNNKSMLNNFLKIALRNALKFKGYTLLNLFGLVIGIASSVLVFLWINDESRIDRFHENGDQIYKVFRNMNQSHGAVITTATTPKPLGDLIKAEYSEVETMVWLSGPLGMKFSFGEEQLLEYGRYTNPDFFNIFSFELILGSKATALNEPKSIVISESVAEKLFGTLYASTALGKIITVNGEDDMQITGVFKDVGSNSSIDFDWLMPANTFFNENDWVNNWGNGAFETYLLIPDKAKLDVVEKRIKDEITTHTAGNFNAGSEELILQQFTDGYLYSNFENGVISGGRIDYVQIMRIVAIFILIVACINFMNLTTARSSRRSKEIGLRKVMGAYKNSIRIQFFIEAILMTMIAVSLSIMMVLILLPSFNNLVNKSLAIDFTQPFIWYILLGITFGVGLLSGSYPALLLSKFKVIDSIKGGAIKQSSFASYFRKGLVVFQFAISTLLIICTSVIYKQIDYVLNKDLGLVKENLLSVTINQDLGSRLDTYKSELLRLPDVTHVSGTSGNPLDYGRSTSSANWEGKNPTDGYEINVMLTDEDFISTSGMQIKGGRDFSSQINDSTNFLINEAAASLMGFEDPLGKNLSFWGINGKIIGVVKNFHMTNLYEPIAPLIITVIAPNRSTNVLIRVNQNAGALLPAIEKISKSISPNLDFEYQFIDQAYAESYASENTMRTLANIFAMISIIISSLGLLGLASYSAEQRSKEIGVRKVHGASVLQVLFLLSKDYSKLILIAFAFALPIGFYSAQGWLDKFEFRTQLDLALLIMACAIVFSIGIITVMCPSLK